jgi:molybdate transport system permease protein
LSRTASIRPKPKCSRISCLRKRLVPSLQNMALRQLRAMFDYSPLFISLRAAILATALVFVLGTIVARWSMRLKGVVASLVDTALTIPLVLPPTVLGFFLLVLFGKNGPAGSFLRIMIPEAWPGILAGLVLSFSRALGEFGATLMIAGNIPGKTQTIPMAIYFATSGGDMKTAWVWVMIIVALSGLSLIGLSNFTRSKL